MKKFLSLLAAVILLLSLTACVSNYEEAESYEDEEYQEDENQDIYDENDNIVDDSGAQSSSTADGLLFTTEYEIVDYVEDVIIVSKNDGLLYGVLDNKGNEVIPVQYDDIDFVNKYDYIEEKNENIYLVAEYEEYDIIFDSNGNEMLRSENKLSDANSYFTTGNVPYFKESLDIANYGEYKLYDENMNYIGTTSASAVSVDEQKNVVSETCYMSKYIDVDTRHLNITFFDYSGNIVNQFYDYSNSPYYEKVIGDEFILGLSKTGNYDLTVFHIDRNGNTLSQEAMTYEECQEKYDAYDAKNYNLYKSNSTWKFEDLNGNPLLDERYFEKIDADGENDCILLTNEDNGVCLFGSQGTLYINYGVLSYDNEALKLLTFDSSKNVNEIFEGKESVIIPVPSSNGGYDIYYYGAK